MDNWKSDRERDREKEKKVTYLKIKGGRKSESKRYGERLRYRDKEI